MIKTIYLYGIHPCLAAVQNPNRKIINIYCTSKNANLKDLQNFDYKIVKPKFIEDLLPKNSLHQGVVVEAGVLKNIELKDLYEESKILVLDQVTDPHNVGAIIRSAAAFGFNSIIMPKDNSIEETPILAKTACGALEKIKICKVTNLARTFEELKKQGFWITALDGNCDRTIDQVSFSGKNILVLGSEGKGLRKLTKAKSDDIVKLPISNNVESLNVSNAAAIAMYEISKGVN